MNWIKHFLTIIRVIPCNLVRPFPKWFKVVVGTFEWMFWNSPSPLLYFSQNCTTYSKTIWTFSETGISKLRYAVLKFWTAVSYPSYKWYPKHISFTILNFLKASTYGIPMYAPESINNCSNIPTSSNNLEQWFPINCPPWKCHLSMFKIYAQSLPFID